MRRLVLILAFLPSSAAFGDQATIQPDAAAGRDTFVTNLYPNTNYGTLDYLGVGCNDSFHIDSLIRFSALDAYVGVRVDSAMLSLYVSTVSGDAPQNGYCATARDPWSELEVTWLDNPDRDSAWAVDYQVYVEKVWISIDVTAIVADWLENGRDNFGFCLYNRVDPERSHAFISSDYAADAYYHPKLILDYEPQTIEPASWGEIKNGRKLGESR